MPRRSEVLIGLRPCAGADGCHGGWLVVSECAGGVESWIAPDIASVAARLRRDAILAIDIPIGLPEKGDRGCCRAARALLGRPRCSSVFPAPLRACLSARTYEAASVRQRRVDGRGMSQQSWAILPKIRDVDRYLRGRGTGLEIVETHPELAFREWAGAPMRHSKRCEAGREERKRLIDGEWTGLSDALWAQVAGSARPDDLSDAIAAWWTARRIRAGAAVSYPSQPVFDRLGLPMRIVT